jgi:hypothetical protein
MGDIAFARRPQSETLQKPAGSYVKGMRNYLIDFIYIEVLVIAGI